MANEADTCRQYVLPKLAAAGWTDEQIGEQRIFTAGRILVQGRKASRAKPKRADYLLFYQPSYPLAVVEAKADYRNPAAGMQQAKSYAETLGLLFAYATNGRSILEFDRSTGLERQIETFPSPQELWNRYRAANGLGEELGGQAARSQPRLRAGPALLPADRHQSRGGGHPLSASDASCSTLATGSDKTVIAFQIAWKLWNGQWNVRGAPKREPRILYLADCTVLVIDPKNESVYGGEAKPLPYMLAQMNLLLHGLEAPKITPATPRVQLGEIGDRDRVDVILTNPPFGGEEERGILAISPRTSAPARRPCCSCSSSCEAAPPAEARPRRSRRAERHPLRRWRGGTIKEELLRSSTCTPSCACRTASSRPTPASRRTCCSSTAPARRGRSGTTSSRSRRAASSTPRRSRCPSRSSPTAWNGGKREENERAWRVPAETPGERLNLDLKNPRASRTLSICRRTSWSRASCRRSADRGDCGEIKALLAHGTRQD